MSTTSGSLAAAAAAAAKNEGRRASKSSFSPRGPSFPNSLPNNSGFEQAFSKNASAVADGPPLSTIAQEIKGQKARIRRASEGSRLSKGESKRQSGSELRCETCGKGYKHSSCLTKHLSVPHPLPPHTDYLSSNATIALSPGMHEGIHELT